MITVDKDKKQKEFRRFIWDTSLLMGVSVCVWNITRDINVCIAITCAVLLLSPERRKK